MTYQITQGDVLAVARTIPDNTYNAILSDPPYGLGFMGKGWDHGVPAAEVWAELLRICKPGAYLFAFGGTRTFHRLAVAIEDAGWEIRDTIMWTYGSGFPKSHDVSKGIDRADHRRDEERQAVGAWLRQQRIEAGLAQKDVAAHWPSATGGITGCVANWELGLNFPTWDQWQELKTLIGFGDEMDAEVWRINGRKGQPGEAWQEREIVGVEMQGRLAVSPGQGEDRSGREINITAPATPAAQAWEGYGTALKPAWEPIIVARKPTPATVAETAVTHGTGAIWIGGGRVDAGGEIKQETVIRNGGIWNSDGQNSTRHNGNGTSNSQGRWPANLIHDGSPEVLALFPETSSGSWNGYTKRGETENGHFVGKGDRPYEWTGDTGSAARFFYCAKADKTERNAGLSGHLPATVDDGRQKPIDNAYQRGKTLRRNTHPTVKPLDLCRYLATLLVPPPAYRDEARLLVPYSGSGSEMIGGLLAGWLNVDGIELDAEGGNYIQIAQARLAYWQRQTIAGAFSPVPATVTDHSDLPLFNQDTP